MRIIIAPDSFKGSLDAVEAAKAMRRGIAKVFPHALLAELPVADGGEGTVKILTVATGGRLFKHKVTGPLGDEVDATWGILGDRETAVIEMAEASGLLLVSPERRNVMAASTYGTGELLKAALDGGAKKIIIGIGGSATNDGGMGMAQALGAGFFDENGRILTSGGAALSRLSSVDLQHLDKRLSKVEITVACDVENPLYGRQGAAWVYARQKGASNEEIVLLDEGLRRYTAVLEAATGKNFSTVPGAGAAGGLGAGLMWFTGAKTRRGIEVVLTAMDFAREASQADLIITGEGCTDSQTACGKVPVGIARIAGQYSVPVVCLSGSLGQGYETVFQHGVYAVESIIREPLPLAECMEQAANLLEDAAERTCRMIKVGRLMKAKKVLE